MNNRNEREKESNEKGTNQLDNLIRNFEEIPNYSDKNVKDYQKGNIIPDILDKFLVSQLIPDYKKETDFIYTWRKRLATSIFVIIIVQLIILNVGVIVLYTLDSIFENVKIDTMLISVLSAGVFAEIVSLVSILFKFIFNRSENKTLDSINSMFSKLKRNVDINSSKSNYKKD